MFIDLLQLHVFFFYLSPQNIATNRANYLLESILESRFPKLFSKESRSAFWVWLSTSGEQQSK